jgi:hypothetical protein
MPSAREGSPTVNFDNAKFRLFKSALTRALYVGGPMTNPSALMQRV